MKLNDWAGSAIAAGLFLTAMVGMRDSVREDWLRDEAAPRFMVLPSSDSVAFPGVKGWGAGTLTTCSRDTVFVYDVSNTSSSGTGSIRSALDSAAAHGDTLKLITFSTGGWGTTTIFSGAPSCTYVAGQTAPGGGYGLYGTTNRIDIDNGAADFVMRGFTVAGDPTSTSASALINFDDLRRGIVAEMTFLWAPEKHMRIGAAATNDTVQDITIWRTLFAESAVEPTAVQITEQDAAGTITQRISIGRSMFHGNSYRNPQITTNKAVAKYDATPRVRMVGNVWYNVGRLAGVEIRGRMVDILDAYCKSGPYTNDGVPSGADYSWCVGLPVDNASRPDSATSLFVERLVGVHNRDTTTSADSLWYPASTAEVACYYQDCEAAGGGDPRDSLDAGIMRATAITPLPTFPLSRVNPFDLMDELAGTVSDSGQVGAYRRIQCDGTWAMRADSALSALLHHAQDSTGLSGSVPDSAYVAARARYTKAAGTPCDDTDGDGIPDAYEDRMSDLDKNDATDFHTDSDGDGWTAIEEYVNGTSSDTYTFSDGDEGGGGFTSTYGNGRNVYLVPVNTDSVITMDTLGAVVDTFVARRPDYDSIDAGTPFRAVIPTANDSALVITCDTMAVPAAGVRDSASVDSILVNWGFNVGSIIPRSVTVPGC